MTGEEGAKVVNPSDLGESSSTNGQSISSADIDSISPSAPPPDTKNNKECSSKDKNCNNIRDTDSGVEENNSDCLGGARNKNKQRNGNNGRQAEENNVLKSEEDCRILTSGELSSLNKEELCEAYKEVVQYVEILRRENAHYKESEEKLKAQQVESSRREHVLIMRLTTKEQEVQDYVAQLNELKQSIAPSSSTLRNALVDPAVNLMIQKMRKELEDTKKKLEDTQNDLNAWKFTPDSNTGKRLMAKCRMLYQENEDLGKMITSGRLAKLESDLALQRSLTEEMKKSQSELDELVQELDEDVEGMQSTICYLQQELVNYKIVSPKDSSSNSNSDSLRKNDDISITVKVADLCAQCQATHQKQQSSQLAIKMEVDDDKCNKNERTCLNGDSFNNSGHSDSGGLKSPVTAPSINLNSSEENDRTPRTSSVVNVKSYLTDHNTNASDSESHSIRLDEGEERTGISEEPLTKKPKLNKNSHETDSSTVNVVHSNQNGSMEH